MAPPARKASKKTTAKNPPTRKTNKSSRSGSKGATATKSAAKRVRAKKAPAKKTPAPRSTPRVKKMARRRAKAGETARAAEAPAPGPDRRSKLGRKWTCFGCNAKFYDLNHPEPICPKCGVDQRTKPAETSRPPLPTAARRRGRRPLAPFLDDDDATTRNTALSGDDLNLQLTGLAEDEEIAAAPDLGLEEEEEAAPEED
jgi:hypothetical protein